MGNPNKTRHLVFIIKWGRAKRKIFLTYAESQLWNLRLQRAQLHCHQGILISWSFISVQYSDNFCNPCRDFAESVGEVF